jgi:hypothetical protein
MATTIANLSLVSKAGYDPGNPIFIDVLNFDLQADYNVAGLLLFSAAVKASLGTNRTVIGVFAVDCKGLLPYYKVATDTLIFRWGAYTGGDGPLIDVPTGNMAGYTSVRLGVISQ